MALQSAELTGQLLVQSRQLQQSYRIVGELSLVLQAYMEGSVYTYKLVQLNVPTPMNLIVIISPRSSSNRFVCVRQVADLCLPEGASYRNFHRACCQKNSPTILRGGDSKLLCKLGGISVTTATASIVTLAACYKALQKDCFKVPTTVLTAFSSLKSSPEGQTVLPLPSHITAACSQPSTIPFDIQMTTPFPTTLPECQLPANFNRKHGLLANHKKHLTTRAILKQQVAELHSWCTNPIQLDRQTPAYKTRTWENVLKHIYLFLGHCHEYHQASLPTLQLYFATPLVASYVSSHMTAKHSANYIRNFLSSAVKVLRWWQTKPGGQHPSFDEGIKWLKTISMQVLRTLHCMLLCKMELVCSMTLHDCDLVCCC